MSQDNKITYRTMLTGLHKTEWDRLQRQAAAIQHQESVDSRKEYFDALNEQSRKWVRHWPDSPEGIKAKLEEERENKRKDNKAFIEAYKKLKSTNNSQERLIKGKQIIFDRSCYGRQLISAVFESRVLDEREIQMRVKKEIEQKEADCERNKKHVVNPLDFDEAARTAQRKQDTIECAKLNKEIEKQQKEEAAKLKAKEDQCDFIDDDMVKQFKEAKAKEKADTKRIAKQEIEEYEKINKKIKERRKITEAHEDALVKAHKNQQDIMRCKIDAVIKQSIEESRSGERAVKSYQMIEELQKAKEKKFNDFILKSVKERDKRKENQEENDKEKESIKRAMLRRIAEENKIAGENHKLQIQMTAPVTKCACDVQTLLVKPDGEKRRQRALKNLEKSSNEEDSGKDSQKEKCVCLEKDRETDNQNEPLSFLRPRRTRLEALQKRAKEPSGYTGSEPADRYFAQQATDTIAMCNHKYFAKKVVDEYLKTNCLARSDLSIPNY